MRINRGVVQEIALFIKTNHLATCAKTRVDTHNPTRTQRSGQQKLLKILRKHADGFFVSLLFALRCKFRFDAGAQQSFISIGCCRGYLRSRRSVRAHKRTRNAVGRLRVIGWCNRHTQHAFRLSATHCQQTVGSATTQRFAPIEIIAIFSGFFLFSFHEFGGNHSFSAKNIAECLSAPFVFADLFCNDVARTLQRCSYIGHIIGEKTLGRQFWIVLWSEQQFLCKGFESAFARHLSFGSSFGFERQIEVFHLSGIPRLCDALSQLVREFPLRFNGFEHKGLAVF